jgi:hypothetical protein
VAASAGNATEAKEEINPNPKILREIELTAQK